MRKCCSIADNALFANESDGRRGALEKPGNGFCGGVGCMMFDLCLFVRFGVEWYGGFEVVIWADLRHNCLLYLPHILVERQ